MHVYYGLLSLHLLIVVEATGCDAREAGKTSPVKTFTMKGVFSVPYPEDGYQWKKEQEFDAQGARATLFSCISERTADRLVLTVEDRSFESDEKRVEALKGYYAGGLQSLRADGFTDLRGMRPSLEAPIPDRVPYGMLANSPSGDEYCMRCVVCFGQRVFLFTAFAASEENALSLLRVADEFNELSN